MTKRMAYISTGNGYEEWYDQKTGFTKKVEPSWIAAPDAAYTYNEALELSLPDKRIPTIRTSFWAPGNMPEVCEERDEKTGKLLKKEHWFHSKVPGVEDNLYGFVESYDKNGNLSGRYFVLFSDNKRIDMSITYHGVHSKRELYCDGEMVTDPQMIEKLFSPEKEEKILKEASMQERFLKGIEKECLEEPPERGLIDKLKEHIRKNLSMSKKRKKQNA